MARPSHVRDAIRERLQDRTRHGWSIDELHEELTSAGIQADYSSVFRAVVHLEREGATQKVDLGDGKARYEAVTAHHEHVQCESCGNVAVVPECVVEDAAAEIEASTGFKVQAHRLVLVGLCPACQTH